MAFVSNQCPCAKIARSGGKRSSLSAAGTAAALALGGNTIPRDIAVEKLQAQLKQQGAFIGQDQAVPEGL